MQRQPESARPVDLVNPLIDSAKRRFFFLTTASLPFGMVNLSPDCKLAGDWDGGYQYGELLEGFSHIHAWQLAGLPVMPGSGPRPARPGLGKTTTPFRHDDEIAEPGYHALLLHEAGIRCEMTATRRVGFHRYAFPEGEEARLQLDLGCTVGPSDMGDASFTRVGERRIEGFCTNLPTKRRPKSCVIHFVLEWDRDGAILEPFQDGAWRDGVGEELEGTGIGCAVLFGDSPGTVQFKLAISYCSLEGARKNMEMEAPAWEFDGVREAAREEWNTMLSRIEVEGGTDSQRVKFYTDLFHSIKGRRCISDADGSYPDNTGESLIIRSVPRDEQGNPIYQHYNSDAFWGAQWSIGLLWSLVYPEIMDGFCQTLLDMHDNGGLVPRGPSGGNYTYVMTGASSTPFVVSAVLKGCFRRDAAEVFAALRKNHEPGGVMERAGYEHHTAVGGGLRWYLEQGYVPYPLPDGGKSHGYHQDGAAQTLEYAFQDWCLAQLAEYVGESDASESFGSRSNNWRNLVHRESGFLRPRTAEGPFLEPFDSMSSDGWVEANAHHYRFWVPHDIRGLAEDLGGIDRAAGLLEEDFAAAEPWGFCTPHTRHELSTVEYGNQPSTGMVHVFNHLERPHRAQYWTWRILTGEKGATTPYAGYGGDEDQGLMGALNVLMAIGLFDLRAGCDPQPRWEIGCPLFDRVTIHLNTDYYPGRKIVIESPHEHPFACYTNGARWNGRSLESLWIDHRDLVNGGTLNLLVEASPAMQQPPADPE